MNLSLASSTLCQTLAQSDTTSFIDAMGDNLVVAIVFGVMGIVGIFAIFFGGLTSMLNTKEGEKTKRELAAYVAEGSMTPEDAANILKTGKEEK